MKNKNLLIGGAVVAGLLFLYFRNRQTDNGELRASDAGLGGGGGAMAQENGGGAVMQTGQPVMVAPVKPKPPVSATTPPTTQLSRFEVEARMLKACGVRPLVKGARRDLYERCLAEQKAILRQQGLISFDGSSDGVSDNQRGRLDFGNNVD
jgi:hypothetical protein